jgi:hypothetical protein
MILFMPDKRIHRGPHPDDAKIFGEGQIQNLKLAVEDFSLLLTKGYAEKSALKLVGDRFSLTQRQRLAVMRCSCSDEQLKCRKNSIIKLNEIEAKKIAIDGYNLLITIESALSGGLIFKGRDDCFKDLASIHGTYRKVSETIPALNLIGNFLKEYNVKETLWLLDRPVSNSGKLKTIMRTLARENNWNWEIELVINPDSELIRSDYPIASSDGIVLDACKAWINLAAEIITKKIPSARLIDLSSV